ncbi:MAG TPA: hypothetical protein VM308_01020 [Sphingomicrobium sp.]|nr:hypothetical protein [Sphingomicrobium sp.]
MTRKSAAALAAVALAAPAAAQDAAPLFSSDEPIRLVIQAPLPDLMRNRDNRVPVQGMLTDPHGQQLPVQLALRGITRRKADTCDFPPLRVDFTTPPPATSLFAGQRRLKLVTHCRNASGFQQHVLLEYAAYRMFNVLSPKSFRVRLANIDYVAPDRRPIASRVGFFIEELADVARRNGTREARAPDVFPAAYLSPLDSTRYALFQHMLANHDWSMRAGPPGEECCHNAKMLGTQAPGQTIPVPYDFDYSGFVSAPYALPPSELRINSVRQRLYRGYCMHNAAAPAAAAEFRAAKPQLIAAIASVPGLEPRTQQRAIGFIEPFFADIATDQSLAAKVLNRCVR